MKSIELMGRKIKKVRVAIVKSGMNKRGSISNSSGVIEIAPNSPKITNMRKIRFTDSRDMIKHRHINEGIRIVLA